MKKSSFIINSLWSFISQSGAILISLIANIILARLLSPYEFGRIGIIMFFITLMNAFSEGGLGGALVRKQNVNDKDFSTVFIFNLFLSIFLYSVLFLTSDLIADFYNDSELSILIKVSGLMIIINSMSIIQNAKIYLSMAFKLNMKINLISSIIGSTIGVIFAFKDYGVWSLVVMNISTLLIKTIYLWLNFGNIKAFIFDKQIFKDLFNYGFFTTIVSLLSTTFDNIYQLILAKYFTLSQSGYYYQARKIQGSPYSVLNTIVLGVFFSQLSRDQNELSIFYKNYISIFKLFSVLITILTSLFLIAGDEIIIILIGVEWLPAVLYMKILSLSALFLLLKVYVQNILKIHNRAGEIFKYEVTSYCIQILFIIAGLYFKDIFILLIGLVISNIIGYVISTYYSWRLLNIRSLVEYLFLFRIFSISIIVMFLIGLLMDVSNVYLSLCFKLVLFLIMFTSITVISKTVSIKDFKNLKI